MILIRDYLNNRCISFFLEVFLMTLIILSSCLKDPILCFLCNSKICNGFFHICQKISMFFTHFHFICNIVKTYIGFITYRVR